MINCPTIGVRFPSWAGSTTHVLGGIVHYMRLHGLWRLVTENDSYGEMEGVKIGVGWQGEGLILYRATQEELEDFRSRGIAVVLLSTEGPDKGYPRVIPDNFEAGKRAAEHLLSLGLKSFAFLGRGETLYREERFAPGIRLYARERFSGFKKELATSNHDPIAHYLPGFPLWEKNIWREIEKAVGDFLETLPTPTGLFTVDDALGAVALRAAEKINKEVPNDLSVIGFGNDLNYCHASLPALTSISYPGHEAGFKAAAQLDLQLQGIKCSTNIPRLPILSVHPRGSSDFLAIDDKETLHLVRWIRQHAPRELIQVNHLKEHTKLSLSTIKARFRKYLGHSPKEEITRVRVQHLQHLLKDPLLSFTKISQMMQFSSTHEMSRFLLRETNERPSIFREKHQLSGTLESHDTTDED